MNRRTALKYAGVGVGSALLAGCTGGDDDDTITIGHIATTNIDLGEGSERGAQIAVDQINDEGGILDREVELLTADDQGNPSEGASRAQEFVERENADLVVGTYVSEVALNVMDTAANAGVPFLVTGGAAPRITETIASDYDHYKNVFQVITDTTYHRDVYADYIEFLSEKHGWDSFALVFEDLAWTEPFSDDLPDMVEDRGLEVTMHERIGVDTTDWTPILDDVEDSGADVMFKALAAIQGPGLLTAWRENEYPFAQEGAAGATGSPEYWEDTNGGSLYETFGCVGANGVTDVTDRTSDLIEPYQERHADSRPTMPMYGGLLAYDAIHIYREVVEDVGTADHENDLDEIVDGFLSIDFEGTTGPSIQFRGPDHDHPHSVESGVEHSTWVMNQWQETDDGGEQVCVFPDEYANADHQAPYWL